MVLVLLTHMHPGLMTMVEKDKEVRAFSTMEKASQWLEENYFYHGRRMFFQYQDGEREWCHLKDSSWEFINVEIMEVSMDDLTASKYMYFHPETAPWLC